MKNLVIYSQQEMDEKILKIANLERELEKLKESEPEAKEQVLTGIKELEDKLALAQTVNAGLQKSLDEQEAANKSLKKDNLTLLKENDILLKTNQSLNKENKKLFESKHETDDYKQRYLDLRSEFEQVLMKFEAK